jgi:hypothetical protein
LFDPVEVFLVLLDIYADDLLDLESEFLDFGVELFELMIDVLIIKFLLRIFILNGLLNFTLLKTQRSISIHQFNLLLNALNIYLYLLDIIYSISGLLFKVLFLFFEFISSLFTGLDVGYYAFDFLFFYSNSFF